MLLDILRELIRAIRLYTRACRGYREGRGVSHKPYIASFNLCTSFVFCLLFVSSKSSSTVIVSKYSLRCLTTISSGHTLATPVCPLYVPSIHKCTNSQQQAGLPASRQSSSTLRSHIHPKCLLSTRYRTTLRYPEPAYPILTARLDQNQHPQRPRPSTPLSLAVHNSNRLPLHPRIPIRAEPATFAMAARPGPARARPQRDRRNALRVPDSAKHVSHELYRAV